MMQITGKEQGSRRRIWMRAGIGLVVLTLVVVVAGTQRGDTTDISPVLRSNLQDVPGFGVSDEDALRDDTIAMWEAFTRQSDVRRCMETAGFQYVEDVAYPAGAVLEVAAGLPRLSEVAARDVSNFSNQGFSDSLAPAERDRYFQTLYGESAADFDAVDATGELPSGRQDFARGGCFGQAIENLPGIWDLKRTLADALAPSGEKVVTSGSAASVNVTAACPKGISSLEDLEDEMLASDTEVSVSAECTVALLEYRQFLRVERENRFFVANATALDAQVANYQGVLETIQRDDAFLEYIAGVVPSLEREMGRIADEDRDE